jgi:alpha-ketoglutaric semialdehyde dehydrogenase
MTYPETLPLPFHAANFVAGEYSALEDAEHLRAIDPKTGQPFGPEFPIASKAEIDSAVTAAAGACYEFSQDHERRAEFLGEIANELEQSKEPLIEFANAETALPKARLEGELARTTKQLRMFAQVVTDGEYLDVVIEKGPPDLRRMMLPIGPVAVFGASNFPFAYSVAGGDTASALAAGCPVIAKAHPSHPGASALAGEAILRAVRRCGLADGVFSMLHGQAEVGRELCLHPLLEAVGFTGSLRGGRALFDLAAQRGRPIPVFAEMGSINPVFVLPGALDETADSFAGGYVASLTLGVGQFCTNPGLLVGIGSAFEKVLDEVEEGLSATPEGTMLNPGIRDAYISGCAARARELGEAAGEGRILPRLFRVSATRFLEQPSLEEELFGPSAVAVACASFEEMQQVAQAIRGQLTASLHASQSDLSEAQALLAELSKKAGRIVCNGFPTGVEVSPAMQHGGPYPATTDSRFTSVGPAAIRRFLRPVVYQNTPESLLPPALRG